MTTQHTPTSTREVMQAALAAGKTMEQAMDEVVAFMDAADAQAREAQYKKLRASAPLSGNVIRNKR